MDQHPLEVQRGKEKSKAGDAAKATEFFLSGLQLDKEYVSPHELEFFELETKIRKLISEIMQPVMNDMDEDRRIAR